VLRAYASSSMPRVKGLAFRSVLAALEAQEGPAVVERARELLPARTRETLAALTANAWYPLESYAELWAAIQAATGNRRDLPRAIGFRAVELDLKLIHRLAFAALSVATVVSISLRLFNTYYDTGSAHCDVLSPRRVRVRFSGCTGFTETMWSEIRGGVECFAAKASRSRASSVVVSGGGDADVDFTLEVYWVATTDQPND
jgi:hypothetical protein